MDANTISLDASTPATVTQSSATTSALSTASFTPPGGSTIVILWGGNSTDPTVPADPTINAVTGLTWRALTINKRGVGSPVANVDGQTVIWWAKVPPGGVGAITVTVNNNAASGTRHAFLTPRVLLGTADWPIGANGIGSDNLNGSETTTFTAQGNYSMVLLTVDDWSASGATLAGTGMTIISNGSIGTPDISYGTFKRTSNDTIAGQNTSVAFSAPGGGASDFKWSYVEILAYEDNVARPQVGPGRAPGSRLAPWRGTDSQAAVTASPIARDTTGSTPILVGATSAVVDITAAAVGAWCYAWCALGANSGTISATGWNDVSPTVNADETTAAHYALLRRQKQSGDTTFTFSWTTSTKGTIGWASWTGLDSTTPDELASLATNGVTSRTTVPTNSATPNGGNRWAVEFAAVRTTTPGNKPITWTPDPALSEFLDVDNNAAGSAPWVGVEIADSGAPVSQTAHSYTATHAPAAESHDGSVILYLIPSSGGAPATNAPAESPSATGAAADATVDVQVNAVDAASTGQGLDAQANVGPSAGQGAATGQGFDTTVDSSATPAAAAGTGTGQDAQAVLVTNAADAGSTGVAADGTGAVGASPAAATGTGTAADAGTDISFTAGQAAATGTGLDAQGGVGALPPQADSTGVASDASTIVNPVAGVASGAGTGQDATISAAGNPDTPIGTGAAADASSSLTTAAGQGGATGVAADGTGAVAAQPTQADSTGTAGDGSNAITVNAEAPTGVGQAFDASVNTSGSTNAPAEAALATGAAADASTAVTVAAGAAAAGATASDAGGSVGASAEGPAATGTGLDAAPASTASASAASATGAAQGVSPDVQVGPTTAQGSGTAYDATVGVYAVQVALAVGQAFDATVQVVQGEVAAVHPDAAVVVGAIMAVVVSPGEPVPVIPGHHARVATVPASGARPVRVIADSQDAVVSA